MRRTSQFTHRSARSSVQQCTDATTELENVIWPMRFGRTMFEPEPFCKSPKKSKISIVIHSDDGLTGGCCDPRRVWRSYRSTFPS